MDILANKEEQNFNSLLSMLEKFHDEKSCREYLAIARWNGNPTCPHCNYTKVYKFKDGKLFKCAYCRKKFTVTVGTIFEDSHIPLKKWFLALYLLTNHKKGIASLQLSKDIKVTQKTAWFMLHRIRYAIRHKSITTSLKNVVEADETFVGGKSKKIGGRGALNKTPVFGIVERKGKVFSTPVYTTSRNVIQPIIHLKVHSNAIIMTDDWKAYKELAYQHFVINHSKGYYVNGDIHTNTIEGYWSLFKRGIIGIYHHISPKHLFRYCNEFDYRYNTRDFADPERFSNLLENCKGRLKYNSLIA